MAKIGDTVRYLNAVGGGRIVRIEGQMAYVDEDGFETPVLLKECVVVAGPGQEPSKTSFRTVTPAPKAEPKPAPRPPVEEPALPIEETAEGEKLNLVVAFEPVDIKKLSSTTFDAVLVNDSNYFIGYQLLSRADDEPLWTLRAAGIVEPNIQVVMFQVGRELIGRLDHVALQYTAWKSHKTFALKAPALVEKEIDTTKFCKLHCFRENVYFDTPVLALDIVRDDEPCIPRPHPVTDAEALQRRMMESKARADRRPTSRPVRRRRTSERRQGDTIEVDLHINELIDNTNGLSNADMLNLQVDEFRRVMDANLRNKGQRIVFIHGKGEGVLRQALMKELTHAYKGHDVQDASFREYGYGATQVVIR